MNHDNKNPLQVLRCGWVNCMEITGLGQVVKEQNVETSFLKKNIQLKM